jgi:LysM repeat protein
MAGRKQRKASKADSAEAVKPLIVLILLGTILYGGYSVIQKGGKKAPENEAAGLSEAPPFDPAAPAMPPVVELATEPAASLPAEAVATAAPPPFVPTPAAGPTYVAGREGAPPTAESADLDPTPDFAEMSSPPQAQLAASEVPPPASFPGLEPQPLAVSMAADEAASDSKLAAFTADWEEAHSQLAAGRYAEALALLSTWYDDASLAIEESQRLQDLLGQLAGTVIYSQEDLLMPPYVVGAGETLPTIAAPLGVNWQLLAKINGIPAPDDLYPGESLKVLRGPFDADVSLARRRVTLRLTGNYAGSFPMAVGAAVAARAGESLAVLSVERGVDATPGGVQQASFEMPAGTPASPLIRLEGDLLLLAAEDPAAMAHEPPATHLIVSRAHLADLIDILTTASRVAIVE